MASVRYIVSDGALPAPGGWARIVLPVDDLAATVTSLRSAGATFRNEVRRCFIWSFSVPQ